VHRIRIRTLVVPPVSDETYPEIDLALVSLGGAAGRSCLAPHQFIDANFGYTRKYTMVMPLAKGVPSLYTTTDYNWDVCEQEAFSVESLTLSITLPNGEEVDFGSGRFVLVELEAA